MRGGVRGWFRAAGGGVIPIALALVTAILDPSGPTGAQAIQEPRPADRWFAEGERTLAAGDAWKARKLFERSLREGFPAGPGNRALAGAWLALDHRRFDARSALERAVAAEPDSVGWWYLLAEVNLTLGGLDAERRAREALREVLRLDPRYRDAYDLWSALYLDPEDSRAVAAILDAHLRTSGDREIALRRIDVLADAGEYEAARAAIDALDRSSFEASHRVRLARLEATVLAALGEVEAGWEAYRAGIGSAVQALDLDPYYGDLEPLLPADDRQRWEGWKLDRRHDFLAGWWTARDPLPATRLNERWVEQMRRIRFARRTFQFKKAWNLDRLIGLGGVGLGLPTLAIRFEGRPLDDRAALYLRHGDPDWRGGVGRDECGFWFYRRPGLPGGAFAVNFRPPGDFRTRGTFLGGDCVYSEIPTTAAGLGHFAPGGLAPWDLERVRSEARADLDVALSSDSYPYPFERWLPIHVDPASFALPANATGGAAEVALYFAVPLREIATANGRARYRKGIVVYDWDWREVARRMEEMEIVLSEVGPQEVAGEELLLDLFRVRIQPGRYHFALQFDDRKGNGTAVWRGDVDVPRFGVPTDLSDIVLAAAVQAGREPARFVRYGHVVHPLPSRTFARGQPIFLYYEVYGQRSNGEGKGGLRVDYTIRAQRLDRSAIRRFFGALEHLVGVRDEEGAITLSFERSLDDSLAGHGIAGSSPWPEFLTLDTSALEPGTYALEVEVSGAGGVSRRLETFTIVD